VIILIIIIIIMVVGQVFPGAGSVECRFRTHHVDPTVAGIGGPIFSVCIHRWLKVSIRGGSRKDLLQLYMIRDIAAM
jgi:hypothetical protein